MIIRTFIVRTNGRGGGAEYLRVKRGARFLSAEAHPRGLCVYALDGDDHQPLVDARVVAVGVMHGISPGYDYFGFADIPTSSEPYRLHLFAKVFPQSAGGEA